MCWCKIGKCFAVFATYVTEMGKRKTPVTFQLPCNRRSERIVPFKCSNVILRIKRYCHKTITSKMWQNQDSTAASVFCRIILFTSSSSISSILAMSATGIWLRWHLIIRLSFARSSPSACYHLYVVCGKQKCSFRFFCPLLD